MKVRLTVGKGSLSVWLKQNEEGALLAGNIYTTRETAGSISAEDLTRLVNLLIEKKADFTIDEIVYE